MPDDPETRKACVHAMREIADCLDTGATFAELAPVLRELQTGIDEVLGKPEPESPEAADDER